jgi:UDP-glucose 4-epimerase
MRPNGRFSQGISLKKDSVLVIGGSGFIGQHIADELSKRGFSVRIFDRQDSKWRSEDQTYIEGDVLDKVALERAMDGVKFVYHLGGIADIDAAHVAPLETIEVNVMGLANTLEVARSSPISRFLYASTMYVYSPFGSFYRASKQAAETIIEAYHEAFDIDYTLLRYGSLYGPRSQSWNGLRQYVLQVINDGKIDYHGSGEERREYIHVNDAARLSVDVLDEAHRNQAITVTGSQAMTSKEMFELIFEIAGKTPNIDYNTDARERYHYRTTPYRFAPKSAKKLIPLEYVDLGQGVLSLFEEIYSDQTNTEKDSDANSH